MSGADCTPAPDITHRHIRGVLGLHCVGGRAGTGCDEMPSQLVVKYARILIAAGDYAVSTNRCPLEVLFYMGPVKFFALIVTICVTLVVGVYWWCFRDYSLSSDPGAWGQWGDYFGGMLNPILSVVNICVVVFLATIVQKISDAQKEGKENSRRRIQAVIELHREWNAEAIYRARIDAAKVVRKYHAMSYFEIEKMVPYDEAANIWIVVGFFQRLEFMIRYENIYPEMVRDLFGELFIWWWVVSFSTQLERCECDARIQMINLNDWFHKNSAAGQMYSWLDRANNDLAVARKEAGLPLLVIT